MQELDTITAAYERVSDVVNFESVAKMLTVVVEVKHGTQGSGVLDQNFEQRIGLFQEGQTTMLGVVIDEIALHTALLRLENNVLMLTRLTRFHG